MLLIRNSFAKAQNQRRRSETRASQAFCRGLAELQVSTVGISGRERDLFCFDPCARSTQGSIDFRQETIYRLMSEYKRRLVWIKPHPPLIAHKTSEHQSINRATSRNPKHHTQSVSHVQNTSHRHINLNAPLHEPRGGRTYDRVARRQWSCGQFGH